MTSRHYEFTGETKETPWGVTLHRIRATRDLPYLNVKCGDLGGWVESYKTERREERIQKDAWVADEAELKANATMFGECLISGNSKVYGNAKIQSRAHVFDFARVSGEATITDTSKVGGHSEIIGSAHVGGEAVIGENASVGDYSTVIESAKILGSSQILGDSIIRGESLISGDAIIIGDVDISGNAKIESFKHFLSVAPVGKWGATAYIYRVGETEHCIKFGTWEGTIKTFSKGVEEYRDYWEPGQGDVSRIILLKRLFRKVAREWSK